MIVEVSDGLKKVKLTPGTEKGSVRLEVSDDTQQISMTLKSPYLVFTRTKISDALDHYPESLEDFFFRISGLDLLVSEVEGNQVLHAVTLLTSVTMRLFVADKKVVPCEVILDWTGAGQEYTDMGRSVRDPVSLFKFTLIMSPEQLHELAEGLLVGLTS